MAVIGIRTDVPKEWNKLWLLMWFASPVVLVYLAFIFPFWPRWVVATIPLFFAPEIIRILKKSDSLPPLTHTIRHFLPNWLAFPFIYFLLGAVRGDVTRTYR